MTKTEKRLEKQLIELLTQACEQLKDEIPHFLYLSHTASLKKLQQTLVIELFCSHSLTASELAIASSTVNVYLAQLSCATKPSSLKVTLLTGQKL
ncbi:hypothetical protein HG263_04865 [Pseudoalteromonas sp. JBTF-M23]|uniref:Uncharacterized protein n=1 Tax=Pseudoalteromonas caenipelagi TaxID=2726988 RepID=A0A849V9F5_9GAMM|nr:hypothetical protein [Pseudoalteromonas caenipelagi]NOU49866.1 hypothetical protein [Pseudoalteromonas caenipelagi]